MDYSALARIVAGYRASEINRVVHPDDLMYNTGPDWYWSVGESGLMAVLQALGASSSKGPQRILDLPCGHGRVARHLRAAFPDADIHYCDLEADGVEFCVQTFGGTGVPSQPELTKVTLPRDLDVIWVGSLFTHVDEERTRSWLEYLSQHLGEDGVLVATFHGPWSRRAAQTIPLINSVAWETILRDYEALGYGYSRYTEYDMGDYGVSLATPSKIMDMASAIPDVRVVGYTERGWANNHDVLALSRRDRYEPW